MANGMLTLLVLAAGWGQRFGGAKQLAQVGPAGEFLLEYALHDAAQAGFERIVFVLRRDLVAEFEARFVRRMPRGLHADIVLQELTDLPQGIAPAPQRSRPWGTLHAVWSARSAISGGFAVINADDFYGADGFATVARFLADPPPCPQALIQGCMAGYRMERTLSAHGGVNRGVCAVRDGLLTGVHEHTGIAWDADGVLRGDEPRGARVRIDPAAFASMNFWAWTRPVFGSIEDHLREFFARHRGSATAEAFMAHWWDHLLQSQQGQCHVLPTSARWAGITYAQDVGAVRQHIAQEISAGRYPPAM